MFSAEYRETSGMKRVDALSEAGHQRCFIKKGVLKNSVKFTRKHLCQSLFLVKLQACCLQLYCRPQGRQRLLSARVDMWMCDLLLTMPSRSVFLLTDYG